MLLERLDKANREQLFPALADGQGAFVIDFTAKSQKWFEKMPPSRRSRCRCWSWRWSPA